MRDDERAPVWQSMVVILVAGTVSMLLAFALIRGIVWLSQRTG